MTNNNQDTQYRIMLDTLTDQFIVTDSTQRVQATGNTIEQAFKQFESINQGA
ncbi:hypothetical protein [Latilactobacillus sakei]|uniref:hypothetical protein n=1 Tax=Latilactobacillus sakei TaxID=1599 RepID=UPI000DC643CE|nr:hypothetical protein [Latilactobacillus sakei]SPS04270.1 hypothetical protein LAS9624_01110 [Latilactobacillus sakei]